MTVVGRIVFAAVVIVVVLIAEVSVMSQLPLPGATPNLVLVAVAAFGLGYGRVPGSIIGFLAGLAADLIPPATTVVGRGALILCLVGYVAGFARERNASWVTPFAVIAGISAVAPFAFAALGEIVGDGVVDWPAVVDLAPSSIGYNLLATPVIVLGVLAVSRRLRSESELRNKSVYP